MKVEFKLFFERIAIMVVKSNNLFKVHVVPCRIVETTRLFKHSISNFCALIRVHRRRITSVCCFFSGDLEAATWVNIG